MLLKHVVMFLAYEYSGVTIVAKVFTLLSCSGTFACSLLTFQYILSHEGGSDTLSQKVSSKLPINDAQDPRRMKTSISPWPKPKISHNMIAVVKLLMSTTSPTVAA
jgi:hypothetical protein